MLYRSPLLIALAVSLAGCIGIPGPAAGDDDDDDDAPPEPELVTCDRSFGELLPSPAFEGVADVRDVVVADLDRDGLDDVIALLEPDRIAVARTRADGGFATPVEVAPGADLHVLATVDLDGDLDADVVAAGAFVVVLRNDAGTLVEETRVEAGCAIDVLVAGQFDDDVRRDLVVGCTASGSLALMRHGARTVLDAPVEIGTFAGLRGAAAGEIAGDDRHDVVVFGSGVELLRAIGGGSFARTVLTSVASQAAAVGDLDADGRDDVIAWAGGGLTWLRGADTPGALVPLSIPDLGTPLAIEVGVIDDNAGADLVVLEDDEISNYQGRTLVIASPLTDASVESQPGGTHARCRIGRLDADDEPDLACMNPYGPLLVPVIHRGVVPAVTRPTGYAALLAQLDGDAALEVFTIGETFDILQPAGDHFVVEASAPSGYPGGEPLALVDWTHDGRPDLVMHTLRDADGAVELLPATGQTAFGEPIVLLDEAWTDLVVGDLDNDTYPDLVGWTYPTSGVQLQIAFGGPGGTIADNILRTGLRPIAIADVVAGGAPELIVTTSGNEIQVLDVSEHTLSVMKRLSAGDFPLEVVPSDLDGDGDLDLVTLELGDIRTRYARTYVYGANNTFWLESSHAMRDGSYGLRVADIDGDGAQDAVTSGLMLLRGQGDGRIAPPVPFARPVQLLGTVPAPAGAAEQLIYVTSDEVGIDGARALEMLAPGCR
jgi:hypothetical protein